MTGVDYSASNNPLNASGFQSTSKILKDGAACYTLSEKEKAAAYYNQYTDTLVVSTRKVSGVYDDAFPGPDSPLLASVYGVKYELTPACSAQLAGIKPGSLITLYLTADGIAAGAEKGATATRFGVVKSASAASVTIDIVGEGEQTFPADAYYGNQEGKLVEISAYAGGVSVTPVKISQDGIVSINFDSAGSSYSPFAAVYEVYAGGTVGSVKRVQELTGTVPASKVKYVHRGAGGLIDVIVLENFTMDGYHFGFLKKTEVEEGVLCTVTYADKNGVTGEYSFTENPVYTDALGSYVGVIPGTVRPAEIKTCKLVGTVTKTDFTFDESVTVNGKKYTISDNYCVYNQTTGRFTTLEKAKQLCTNFKIFAFDDMAAIIIAS